MSPASFIDEIIVSWIDYLFGAYLKINLSCPDPEAFRNSGAAWREAQL